MLLGEGSEYSPSSLYERKELSTPIDMVEFFPPDFQGDPNITITADGRSHRPTSFQEVEYYDHEDNTSFFHKSNILQNHSDYSNGLQDIEKVMNI